MKELITRIEELAVQLTAANRQIEISATDARDALGQLNIDAEVSFMLGGPLFKGIKP